MIPRLEVNCSRGLESDKRSFETSSFLKLECIKFECERVRELVKYLVCSIFVIKV